MDLQPGQAILGQKVDVVFIGSTRTSRIWDLRQGAQVLRDRQVADGVRIMIVPEQQCEAQAERRASMGSSAPPGQVA